MLLRLLSQHPSFSWRRYLLDFLPRNSLAFVFVNIIDAAIAAAGLHLHLHFQNLHVALADSSCLYYSLRMFHDFDSSINCYYLLMISCCRSSCCMDSSFQNALSLKFSSIMAFIYNLLLI